MYVVLTFLTGFFSSNDLVNLNEYLLIAALMILLAALAFCIYLSKKYHLYDKPKKKDDNLHIVEKNEVA